MIQAIEVVYEATAVGLTLAVEKCRFAPNTRFIYLGILINTDLQRFYLSQPRARRLAQQTRQLVRATRGHKRVPAKLVAQYIGLLWAASPCCPRGVAVMARGLIATLTDEMRATVFNTKHGSRRSGATWPPLRTVLSRFWHGDVDWSWDAETDLAFWVRVNFGKLSAPISSDTTGALLKATYLDCGTVKHNGVSFLASDASAFACGGGQLKLSRSGFVFGSTGNFVSDLPPALKKESSGLREIVSILWMLEALQPHLARKVIVFTDSQAAATAIKRGSRNRKMQQVVRAIFLWAMERGATVFPCWTPRTFEALVKADELSRVRDEFDVRTPPTVYRAANNMAVRLWGRGLSFDRQASHLNAMPPPGLGDQLPYNSLWHQPGCHGVDMFLQDAWSYAKHINFVHPAAPTVGRVLTFLPANKCRAVVVIPLESTYGRWWSTWTRIGGPGVVDRLVVDGFVVLGLDHSPRYRG